MDVCALIRLPPSSLLESKDHISRSMETVVVWVSSGTFTERRCPCKGSPFHVVFHVPERLSRWSVYVVFPDSSDENPIVGWWGLRLLEKEMAAVVRLYSYGEFFLVREAGKPLFWTGSPTAIESEEEGSSLEILACAQV